MKTKISLFISACMFFAFSFAQKAVVPDSIHKIKMDSMAKLSGRLMNVDIDSAKAIADRMLKYSEKHHFLRGQAQSLATLGSFYNSQGDKGKALQYFKRTYDIFEALDNHILAHRISILVSELFRQTKDYDQALAYAKKTLQYLEKNKDNRGLARAYHVMALIHEDMGNDFDQVMFYLKKAEAVSRGFIKDTTNSKTQINLNTSELCGILNSQSEVHLKRGKNTAFAIDRANASLKRIKIYNPKDNYFSGKSHVLLGEAHYKQKQYRKALLHNDSSLVAYKAMNYAVGLKEAYKSRKKILVQMGDYQKALDITELAAGYQDSISDVAKEKEFSRMKAEYETDRIVAEKEVAEARAALAETTAVKNKNYLIGGAIIIGLLVLSLFFYLRKTQAEYVATDLKQAQKRLVLQKKYRASELKALKSQMNPHFIFNTLNSIQDYIIRNKKEEASDYLGDFANLIRCYLNYSTQKNISLAEEIHALKMYLKLEALRFEEDFNYRISLSSLLDADAVHVPSMMVQPYLENAIRHGLLHKDGTRKLLVSFTKGEGDVILCIVEDNGIGRKEGYALSQKRYENHKSFAEKATQERLQLFNMMTDAKVGVEIIDLKKEEKSVGTKVVLSLPILS